MFSCQDSSVKHQLRSSRSSHLLQSINSCFGHRAAELWGSSAAKQTGDSQSKQLWLSVSSSPNMAPGGSFAQQMMLQRFSCQNKRATGPGAVRKERVSLSEFQKVEKLRAEDVPGWENPTGNSRLLDTDLHCHWGKTSTWRWFQHGSKNRNGAKPEITGS